MWDTACARSPAIGRECGFAYKPSPEALLYICSVWGIAGEEAVFVGDSAKDDVRWTQHTSPSDG
jgi:FMN phosphatase YigB (HAD superfamily)